MCSEYQTTSTWSSDVISCSYSNESAVDLCCCVCNGYIKALFSLWSSIRHARCTVTHCQSEAQASEAQASEAQASEAQASEAQASEAQASEAQASED